MAKYKFLFIGVILTGVVNAWAGARAIKPPSQFDSSCEKRALVSSVVQCLRDRHGVPEDTVELYNTKCNYLSTANTTEAVDGRRYICWLEAQKLSQAFQSWEPSEDLKARLPIHMHCRQKDPMLWKVCFINKLSAWEEDLKKYPQCWDAGPKRKDMAECVEVAAKAASAGAPDAAPAARD